MDMQTISQTAIPAQTEADGSYYTAALSKGALVSDVSRQWATRSDDEKFTSLSLLLAHCREMRERSSEIDVDATQIRVIAEPGNADRLALELPTEERHVLVPNFHAFGQLAALVGAPAADMRKIPARLAAARLQYGLLAYEGRRSNDLRAYVLDAESEAATLRASTSTSYGRIADADVVEAVMKVAGNGTGDARWKVPGMLDWSSRRQNGTVRYNPNVDVTKDTTTLFAGERDVFMFLCDDRNPIEVGKLPDGSPDIMFRGFYVTNSEVGSSKYIIAAMLLRGVCCNRNLWGVEGFQTIEFNHTSGAPARFLEETSPTLLSYAEAATAPIVDAVRIAKGYKIGDNDEDAIEWVTDRGFTKAQAVRAARASIEEEQRPMRTVWDAVQGLTAFARTIPHNDDRLLIEKRASKLIQKVAA